MNQWENFLVEYDANNVHNFFPSGFFHQQDQYHSDRYVFFPYQPHGFTYIPIDSRCVCICRITTMVVFGKYFAVLHACLYVCVLVTE